MEAELSKKISEMYSKDFLIMTLARKHIKAQLEFS